MFLDLLELVKILLVQMNIDLLYTRPLKELHSTSDLHVHVSSGSLTTAQLLLKVSTLSDALLEMLCLSNELQGATHYHLRSSHVEIFHL